MLLKTYHITVFWTTSIVLQHCRKASWVHITTCWLEFLSELRRRSKDLELHFLVTKEWYENIRSFSWNKSHRSDFFLHSSPLTFLIFLIKDLHQLENSFPLKWILIERLHSHFLQLHLSRHLYVRLPIWECSFLTILHFLFTHCTYESYKIEFFSRE